MPNKFTTRLAIRAKSRTKTARKPSIDMSVIKQFNEEYNKLKNDNAPSSGGTGDSKICYSKDKSLSL